MSFSAPPDKYIFLIKGDDGSGDCSDTEVAFTASHSDHCYIPSPFDGDDCWNILADGIFNNMLIACGGSNRDMSTIHDRCMAFYFLGKSWMPVQSMPMAVAGASSLVFKEDGRDKYWLVSGGQDENGNGHVL